MCEALDERALEERRGIRCVIPGPHSHDSLDSPGIAWHWHGLSAQSSLSSSGSDRRQDQLSGPSGDSSELHGSAASVWSSPEVAPPQPLVHVLRGQAVAMGQDVDYDRNGAIDIGPVAADVNGDGQKTILYSGETSEYDRLVLTFLDSDEFSPSQQLQTRGRGDAHVQTLEKQLSGDDVSGNSEELPVEQSTETELTLAMYLQVTEQKASLTVEHENKKKVNGLKVTEPDDQATRLSDDQAETKQEVKTKVLDLKFAKLDKESIIEMLRLIQVCLAILLAVLSGIHACRALHRLVYHFI